MDKDEFVRLSCLLGYSSEKDAKAYVEGRETLNDDDFIELYRQQVDKHRLEQVRNDGRWHYCGSTRRKKRLDNWDDDKYPNNRT